MYSIGAYGGMIAFAARTGAYARALEAHIVPGAVVLDIGCGAGILSLLACRAGAARVYAVEPDDIIQVARDAARDNGFLDRIEFIQGFSTAIDLPETVDGIVTDVHGVLPLFGKSVVSILDARDRWLKPGGWIIPARENIQAAPARCPDLHSAIIDCWNTGYGFDFKPARNRAINTMQAARLKPDEIVTAPQSWAVLDYRRLGDLSVNGEVSWLVDRAVEAHGIAAWYDCETSAGFSFSNSPAATEPFVYRHAFFPWPAATELAPGDRVTAAIRADFVDVDYIWSWNTLVTDESGRGKVRYRQSTFIGEPPSRERLRKRAHNFVPAPNDDLRIDRRALDLMERRLPLGDIATALQAEFPARFKDWNAALARVADLAEKYSR